MNIVLQITEKDLQKGSWVKEEVLRIAERLAGAEPAEPEKDSHQAPLPETPAPEPVAPAAEPGIGIEDVRAAIVKVSKKHGTERAKEILRKFGVENLSALEAAHYAAALAEAEAAL